MMRSSKLQFRLCPPSNTLLLFMCVIILLLTTSLYFQMTSTLQAYNNNNNNFNFPGEFVSSSNRELITASVRDAYGELHTYSTLSPIVFVCGFPRSGTTLFRAMLDSHPDVRCGQETRVIPAMLKLADNLITKDSIEHKREVAAGITDKVFADAVSAFILQNIVKHGPPAKILCNKDPLVLEHGVYLKNIFPNAKLVFMVRDGRAAIQSAIVGNVTIGGMKLSNHTQCLENWSNRTRLMYDQCKKVGLSSCLPVRYEQLVLKPREQMERALRFLSLPWQESVLHHEQFINKTGGIVLSKYEKTTIQVQQPIHINSLYSWVDELPDDLAMNMSKLAPTLQLLGYNPNENPPNYEKLKDVDIS